MFIYSLSHPKESKGKENDDCIFNKFYKQRKFILSLFLLLFIDGRLRIA